MTNTPPLVSVVDDDESVRESLPDLLRAFGFTTQAFSSAEEFLASADIGQTRCLILDIAMPGMDGLELSRTLRGNDSTSHVPIIAVSGNASDRAREAGCNVVLEKPCAPDALLHVIEDMLKEPGQE